MGIKIKQIDGLQQALDNAGGGGGGDVTPVYKSYIWKLGNSSNDGEFKITQGDDYLDVKIEFNIKSKNVDFSTGDLAYKLYNEIQTSNYLEIIKISNGDRAYFRPYLEDNGVGSSVITIYLVIDRYDGSTKDYINGNGQEFEFRIFRGIPNTTILPINILRKALDQEIQLLQNRLFRLDQANAPDFYCNSVNTIEYVKPVLIRVDITGKTSVLEFGENKTTITKTDLENESIPPVEDWAYNYDELGMYTNSIPFFINGISHPIESINAYNESLFEIITDYKIEASDVLSLYIMINAMHQV